MSKLSDFKEKYGHIAEFYLRNSMALFKEELGGLKDLDKTRSPEAQNLRRERFPLLRSLDELLDDITDTMRDWKIDKCSGYTLKKLEIIESGILCEIEELQRPELEAIFAKFKERQRLEEQQKEVSK